MQGDKADLEKSWDLASQLLMPGVAFIAPVHVPCYIWGAPIPCFKSPGGIEHFGSRNPSIDGGLAALVFDISFENFHSGATDRTEEEAAGPEGALMLTPVDGAESVRHSRCALAFECSDHSAENDRRRIAEEHVDMIFFAIPL